MSFQKRKIIGIMGSGMKPYPKLSIPLAKWIARQNYHLLTGGGGGVMAAAASAFCRVENRQGISIGVIPTELNDQGQFIPLVGYPNPWIELTITSPLSRFNNTDVNQLSRNYICILSSDIVVILPGNQGTRNELDLALRFQKPTIILTTKDEIANFPDTETIVKTSAIEDVINFILNHV